jgi:hypothetical protein
MGKKLIVIDDEHDIDKAVMMIVIIHAFGLHRVALKQSCPDIFGS